MRVQAAYMSDRRPPPVLVEVLEQGVNIWPSWGRRWCSTLWGPLVVAVAVERKEGSTGTFLGAGITAGWRGLWWGRDGLVPDESSRDMTHDICLCLERGRYSKSSWQLTTLR